MTILDLQKKISEGDTKLKQQQNLYEAVRSDRNLYSKSLIESQDEIAEMKRKFKIMNHQIEQLKEEIQAKDQVKPSAAFSLTPPLSRLLSHLLPPSLCFARRTSRSAWSTRGRTRRRTRSRTS